MKKILVIGAGGHGRSVAESILIGGQYNLVGFVDDSQAQEIWNYPIVGKIDNLSSFRNLADYAVVAIGNNKARQAIHDKLLAADFNLANIIHPTAIVSPSAQLGSGVVLMSGAIVGTEARLGHGAILNCGAVVDHHCVVEDFGHLGVNSCMAGGSVLGRLSWLQAGSALGYGVVLQPDTIVSPGQGIQKN